MGRNELSGQALDCYECGAPGLTMPAFKVSFRTLVITDRGTAYPHMKAEHPAEWARLCDVQRAINRRQQDKPPRKVDGTFLLPGQQVGDIG